MFLHGYPLSFGGSTCGAKWYRFFCFRKDFLPLRQLLPNPQKRSYLVSAQHRRDRRPAHRKIESAAIYKNAPVDRYFIPSTIDNATPPNQLAGTPQPSDNAPARRPRNICSTPQMRGLNQLLYYKVF